VADRCPGRTRFHMSDQPSRFGPSASPSICPRDKYNYSRDYLVIGSRILLGGPRGGGIVFHSRPPGRDELEKPPRWPQDCPASGISDKMGPLTFGKGAWGEKKRGGETKKKRRVDGKTKP